MTAWTCRLFGHRWYIGAMYAPRVCRVCGVMHPKDKPTLTPQTRGGRK